LFDKMVRLALGECSDVAGIVDGDRAADGVGDLQTAVQSGIEQKNALAIREFDRRHLGLARNLGDAVQIRVEFAPAPHIGQRLHLVGGDAARRELPAAFAARLAEPGSLRRRIRLGADPHVVLGGVSVDGFHHLARLVGERSLRLLGGCGGGHDVFSLRISARCPGRPARIKPNALK
jgi:hypothetical protein